MTLAKLAEHLGQALKSRKLSLTTAESCTGGGLSYWITSIPNSSDWFERGFVTYSNEAKIELLGIRSETIENFGAVSQETAVAMAEGALSHSHADLSIAITGIAGPSGGSKEKPVGTVWIAWGGRSLITISEVSVFSGDRQEIRQQAIKAALQKFIALIESV